MLAKHAIINLRIFIEIQRALLKLSFQVLNIGIAHTCQRATSRELAAAGAKKKVFKNQFEGFI
jgi:hypothetical protein